MSEQPAIHRFTSAEAQFVTILVVPESAVFFYPQAMSVLYAAAAIGFDTPLVAPAWRSLTDDLDLEILDEQGDLVGASESLAYLDWVQARVPAGRLEARVTLRSTWSVLSPMAGDYRLIVVGSGARIQGTSDSPARNR